MHRFFISDENLCGENVVLKGKQAHQIRNVLRMRPGDHVIVLDNRSAEYEVELELMSKSRITGHVIEKREATGEPAVQITLYQSLVKQDKFEWVLQKCTEVGVKRFVPLITQRSVIQDPGDISSKKLSRWRSIITEAAEQSGRGLIPELSRAISLEKAIGSLAGFGCCLIASRQTERSGVRSALRRSDKGASTTIALLIGPEGGFTEEEVKRSQARGAIPISLGRRILRTETAAVVAASLILYELNEMEP